MPHTSVPAYPSSLTLPQVLNDLLLLSFLVGNDFLPHTPALAIEEDGLDLLFGAYKRLLPSLGGFLVANADVVPQRLQRLLQEVATEEIEFLKAARSKAEAEAVAEAPPVAKPAPSGGAAPRTRGGPKLSDLLAAEPDAEVAAAVAEPTAGEKVAAAEEGKTLTVAAAPAAPPPWAKAGGFSFAKVLMGERLGAKAAAAKGEAGEDGKDGKECKEGKEGKESKAKKKKGAAKEGKPDAALDKASAPEASASTSLMAMLGIGGGGDGAAAKAAVDAPSAPPPAVPETATIAAAAAEAPPTADDARRAAVTAALHQLAASPLTSASLEGVEEGSRDEMLGERLYALIEHLEPGR